MKKNSLFLLLFTGWYAGIDAQVARPVTISGQVKTGKDSVRLVVWLGKDLVTGYGGENIRLDAPVHADGTFSLTTPPISQVARLEIFDAHSRNYLFFRELNFISPGDQIQLTATAPGRDAPNTFQTTFSGTGSAKYECLRALDINFADMYVLKNSKDGFQRAVVRNDSLLKNKHAILKQYESKISKEEYNLILADLTGLLKWRTVLLVCGMNPGSVHSVERTAEELAQVKKNFYQLMTHFKDIPIDNKTASQSIFYRRYLESKAKAEQFIENNGQFVTMTQLFNRINKQYTGSLRDKLLGNLVLNQSERDLYFGGVEPAAYAECLQNALSVVESDELKERIKQSLDTGVQGVPAFNFSLPVDSSDTKTLSLTDLKGKVVLLDLWGYQCTGCVLFTNAFHKKIYPAFKNNPDFAVVSIMLDSAADKEKYYYRLRRAGGVAYTFPDYINLYGGKGVNSAVEMKKYHKISAFPTVLLIDKDGRLISSTLPSIYGPSHDKDIANNVQKVINLIQQALSKPAAQKPNL